VHLHKQQEKEKNGEGFSTRKTLQSYKEKKNNYMGFLTKSVLVNKLKGEEYRIYQFIVK
jgi:hypothetical protein